MQSRTSSEPKPVLFLYRFRVAHVVVPYLTQCEKGIECGNRHYELVEFLEEIDTGYYGLVNEEATADRGPD